MQIIGIIFSFLALISWGFGDFFIQSTARALGIVKALFYIGFGGMILLLPFAYSQIGMLFSDSRAWIILALASVIAFFASLFDFEALKEGKISIIEPIIGIELPITVALSVAFNNEVLSLFQVLLIAAVFIGIMLAVT
ncbi:MAG TPA: EamA family transporter, partial [Verrucomicrobiae bacterium]|nr:EamA family transporter [Verrucomicrobiae bacterium]